MKDWTWWCFEVTSSLGCSMIQWLFLGDARIFFIFIFFAFCLDWLLWDKNFRLRETNVKPIHCLSHRSIFELQKATSIPALGTGYVCGEWEISLNSLVVQRQRSLLDEHFLDQHLRYHHLLWKTVEIGSVESRDSQVLIWCSLGMPLVFSPDGDYAKDYLISRLC